MGTIVKTAKSTGRLGKLVRLFARSDRGVTAIEFAIVGPVFLALIGATIETALAFFAGYALDAAVIDTSRLIRTGQAAYISSADNYRAALCGQLYGIFDCEGLRISVREIDNFAAFAMSDPINTETGAWTMTETYDSAQPLETMMIEAYYKWPTFFNIPGLNAGQTADGRHLLAATHVIRTEPFSP